MFSYISCDHGLFFSDLRCKAEYHSPNVPLVSMQVRYRWLEPNVWWSVVDAICGWSQRRGCKASKCQERSQRRSSRFDLWGIPDPRMRSLWISRAKSKTRVWCVHVHVGVHDRRFRIQSERNYKPRAKPKNKIIIMWSTQVSWAKLKPTSRKLRVSRA